MPMLRSITISKSTDMSFTSNIRILFTLAAAALLTASCVTENFTTDDKSSNPAVEKIINTPDRAVEGQLLVCLSAEAAAKVENGQNTVITDSDKMNVTGLKPVFPVTEHNRKFLKKYGLDRWYQLEFDGQDLTDAANVVAEYGEVRKVQFNTLASCGAGESAKASSADGTADAGLPFNDEKLADQWHYINTGDKLIATDAVEGADIGVKDVWGKLGVGGDNEIVVAILDGPVKYTHEDLRDNMWINIFEKAGDGIDNDGNGYIDDVHGWNFERDTVKIDWTKANETGHGTHVAGIVAAVNNNGKGCCGVAGGTGKGDGVRLMSCQILEGGAAANLQAAAKAFVYAADNGAHIAQCSFGYRTPFKSDYDYFYNYGIEYFAIQYFLDKERFAEMEEKLNAELVKAGKPERTKIIDGPLVIFAAGNDGLDKSSYPGALMDCICVTGTGPDGLPAYYTNFGPGSNIAAPGGDIYLNLSTGKSNVLSTCVSEAGFGDYAYMGGTSMACPHVSGVAALGLAYAKRLGKTFTREEFTALLLSSVNDIDSRLNAGYKHLGTNASTGADNPPRPYTSYQYNMGTGSIDAWRLMMNIEGTPVLAVKMGADEAYDLSAFFGEGAGHLTYAQVEMDAETKKSLGILKTPYIENGKLIIDPSKTGSGKIKITAIAGGSSVAGSATGDWTGNGGIVTVPNSNGGTGGMYITREISIISRGVASKNGGWL